MGTTHPPMINRLGQGLLLTVVLVLAGCRGEPAGPAGQASRLVLVQDPPGAVTAGSETPASFTVAARDGRDEPVEGLRLRFLVLAGGGSVEPATAVTGAEGEASARFLPGDSPGEARIRIHAPDAHDVGPLIVQMVQEPTVRLRIREAGGDGQEAEPGTQLPRPFRVTVRRPDGTAAAGVPLVWELSGEPGGARLEPRSLTTDTAGRASALLTLSPEPGVHQVRVRGGGATAGDTARFTARGVGGLAAELRIDSVTPRPLRPGTPAALHGEALPAGDLEVRVDGRPAEVLERSASRLRVRIPPARGCRPDRPVGVRLLAGDRTSNGLMVPLRGAGPRLDHEPGEIRTYGPGEAGCLQLPADDGVRSYRIVVHSVARDAAGVTGLELTTRAGGSGAPGTAAGSAVSRVRPARDRLAPLLQGRSRRELRLRGARPAAPAPPAVRAGSPAAAAAGPETGDLLRFRFAVAPDLSVSCADTSRTVTARVRALRPAVVLAEDTAGAGGFATADHELLAREFQELVFPTDTAYFGAPSDLDGNGRVIVLFSPRVNELTPRGATAAVGGFFLPLDLAEAGDGDDSGVPGPGGETCPASNEAEILYLPVPDPDGLHGPEFSRAEALRNARAIVAHELMHLLSASQRVVLGEGGFPALEELWLAEALSHLAEEVVGHAFRGNAPGAGLDFRDFSGDRAGLEAFNTFHLQNFGRLQLYLLDPSTTPALAPVDPGGTAGLRMRGFGWLLVRWLADRFAEPETEAEFVRRLSTGGPSALTGIENVTAAAGSDWPELLEDFALLPVLEGRDLPAADGASRARASRARLTTWELRETYSGLSENPGSRSLFPLGYPLRPGTLTFEDARRPLELRAGTARYLSLAAGSGSPALALGLAGTAGAALPAGAPVRLTVVRLR